MDEKVVKDLIDRLIDLSLQKISAMATIPHYRVSLPMLWENQNF